MLVKSFCSAAAFALVGVVIWSGSGCSGASSAVPATDPDAGGSSGTSGGATSGGTTDDSGTGQTNGPDAAVPGVVISYGSCNAFSKCGGDLVGSWKLSGGCLSPDTFAAAKTDCPGLVESNVDIHASGTIDITATTLKRVSLIKVTAKVLLPKSCSKNLPCAFVGTGLTTIGSGGIKFDTADCKDDSTGTACNCDVGSTYNDNIDTTYTSTPDGTLTTAAAGANPQRTYDYCSPPATSKLTFTETTASQPLKLFVEITK